MDGATPQARRAEPLIPPEVPELPGGFNLASILDASGDAIWVLDDQWRFTYVNSAAETLAGITREQLSGKCLWDVFPEATGTQFEKEARRAVAKQQRIAFEQYLPTTGRWYELRLFPTPQGLLFFATDIHERKRADEQVREKAKRYQHLFHATNDGILIVDDQGRYVDVNKSFCRTLKTSRERLIGAHFSEFIPPDRLDSAIEAFEAMKAGRPTFVVFPLQAVDGSIVQLEWRSVSHYLPNLSFCICRDLTESQRADATLRAAEGAVRASEERFGAILETTPECVKVVAFDGALLHMNSSGLNMVGAGSAEAVIGKNVYDPIAPEFRKSFIEFNESICRGEKGSLEFDIIGLDGRRRQMESHAAPLRQPDGTIAQLAVTHDITERKRRERATLLLGAIVDSSDDAIISKDLNGVITSWNNGAERLFGYSAAEVIGRPVTILIPPDRLDEEPDILARLRRGERVDHFETMRRRKDGRPLNISLTISPVRDTHGKIIGASKIARDISARMRAEKAIQELNAQLTLELSAMKRMQQLSTRLIQADDFTALLGEIVDAGIEITGADMGNIQLLENGALEIVSQRGFDPPFLEYFKSVHNGMAASGTALERGARIIVEDVADSPVFAAGTPERDVMLAAGSRAVQSTPLVSRTGQVLGMFSTHYRAPHQPSDRELRLLDLLARQAADLIERKRAEVALLAGERRFRQLADAMPQMVWTARPDGYLDYYNERWYEFTGFTREQFGDVSWKPILHPDDAERCYAGWYGSVERGQPYGIEYRFWDRRESRWRWFMGRALPVRNSEGEIVKWFGTCTDIDDQKRVEDELRRANQDLEQFAYSASHDLQEPLRSIRIFGNLLTQRCGSQLDEQARQFLDYLQAGAARMEVLVRDLLTYTQTAKLEAPAEPVDANEALTATLDNLSSAVAESGANVTYGRLPFVRVHDTHLRQLFQNLIGNAIKYRSSERSPQVHITGERQNGSCLYSIRDNGIGIEPEYKEYIFGLFKRLHTGDEYSGTGIGLAICQRIVERYNGRIRVDSEPGRGSTFTFEIPG